MSVYRRLNSERKLVIEAWYQHSVNALDSACQHGAEFDAHAPFDRRDWYALLAETGLQPLFAGASYDAQTAFLALTEENGHLTPLRNWYSFTWRPIARPDDIGDRLLRTIASTLKAKAFRVTLEPVPDEDGAARQLAKAFRDAGWSVEVQQCDSNHVLPVGGRDFATYWASRPGKLRTTLKRKAKKVEIKLLSHFDPEAWRCYEAIYQRSWKPAEDHPEMLKNFAQAEGTAGRMRMALAYLDGEAIAAQFWTVENGVAYIHKLAHLEEHNRLSAGTTVSAALFEHVIDRDQVDLIDFGTGDESYKRDWMEQVRPRYRIDCLSPGDRRAWLPLAKRFVRRLASPHSQS